MLLQERQVKEHIASICKQLQEPPELHPFRDFEDLKFMIPKARTFVYPRRGVFCRVERFGNAK
jgi:hypothetical protein